MEKLGDKIYDLRIAANLSQEQLGEKVGVSRQTVSLWEANKRQINVDMLGRLCEVFGVSAGYFIDTSKDGEESVVCAEVEQAALSGMEFAESKRCSKKRNQWALIIVVAMELLIAIVALIFAQMASSYEKGWETAVSRDFNFDIETISWLIFAIFIVVAIVTSIILALMIIRRKRNINKGDEND